MPAKPQIIADPQTNRGTAFTLDERKRFGLMGRLPAAVETLEQQAARAYKQVCRLDDDLDKYIYLEQLHDRNETLYYKVIIDHIAELLPVIYDPTIGEAIKKWSADYRRSRAIYLSVDRVEDVRPTFEGLGLGPDDVDLLVVSDAEQILGIGDWGVNGTDISVGKLAVYTAAAGIDPSRVIAVNLDVGTDNEELLNDPDYLGNRHGRVRGERYDALVNEYLSVTSELYPRALLHFEDFGASSDRHLRCHCGHEDQRHDLRGPAPPCLRRGYRGNRHGRSDPCGHGARWTDARAGEGPHLADRPRRTGDG